MGFFQNLFGGKKENETVEEDDLEMDAEILSGDYTEEKPIVGTNLFEDYGDDLPQTPSVEEDLVKTE